MNITLSARSKILQLTVDSKPFRIQATGDFVAGAHIDLIPNSSATDLDVTICYQPLVIADMSTVNHLNNQSVDFNYDTEEFIISNRGNE